MKYLTLAAILVTLLVSASFFPISAHIGVGVGSGKITVDNQLKPGVIYQLPPINVINTGDQSSDYILVVTYHDKQSQLKPPQTWFHFNPDKFHLEPGKVQLVKITLDLPLKAEPGDYFAYLEAHPDMKNPDGSSSVSIAAASKLYFTVVPASVMSALYYKVLSFWRVYSPWPQRFIVLLAVATIFYLLKKNFKFQVSVKK
ncbi:MAG TPA: hypothetical protein VF828_02830 [Patescibacteria group bacterium]